MRNAFILLSVIIVGCSESRLTRMQRLLLQGNEAAMAQRYEDAERYFKGALALDSCFEPAWNNLGSLNHKQGRYSDAIAFYERGLTCDTTHAATFLNLANSQLQLRNFMAAHKALNRYERLAPDSLQGLELRALIYWQEHRFSEAIAVYKKAYRQDPKPDYLVNVANNLIRMGQYDSALQVLERVRQMDSTLTEAGISLALVYTGLGDFSRAEALHEKLLIRYPGNPYVQNNLAYLLINRKDTLRARQLLRESLLADPQNPWVYRNLGILEWKLGHYGESVRLLKLAEERDPWLEELAYYLALNYDRLNNHELACKYQRLAKIALAEGKWGVGKIPEVPCP